MADIATLGLRLDANGFITGAQQATRASEQLAQSGGKVEGSFTKSSVGANRLASALGPLVAQATGANPILSRLASTVGILGIGSTVMVGVLAGVAALSFAYGKLTEDSRKAREETQKLIDKLAEAYDARQKLTAQGRQKTAAELSGELRGLLPGVFLGASVGNADTEAVDKALKALREYNLARAETMAQSQTIDGIGTRTTAQIEAEAEARREATQALIDYNNQLVALGIQLTAIKASMSSDLVMELMMGPRTMRSTRGVSWQDPSSLGRITKPSTSDPSKGGPGWLSQHSNALAGGAGLLLGSGMAGNGAFASAASGALTMGAQGAMIAGPIGAIVGGVGGLVKGLFDHGKRAKEAAELMKQAQTAFDADINARRAAAAGNTQQAEDIRRAAQYEKELAEARKAGLTKASIAALQAVQAEERAAVARNRATEATEKATQALKEQAEAQERLAEITRSLVESLTVRGLRAVGQGDLAERAAQGFSQSREWEQAIKDGLSADTMRQLAVVQAIEREALLNQQWLQASINAVQSAADAQLAALADQREIAEAQLRVAQDALRAQEQTVNAMRQVVDSLADYAQSLNVGQFSPLSPVEQLNEARKQFAMLKALAMGGDLSAAQSLAGAGNTLLGASRGYNNSGAGYVADFKAVQDAINAVRDKYSNQLTVEQQILGELQKQTASLQAQLAENQATTEAIRAKADAQIAAFQAEFNDKQNTLWQAWQELTGIAVNTNLHAADQNEINTLRTNTTNIINSYEQRLAGKDEVIAELLSALVPGFGAVVSAVQENTAAVYEAADQTTDKLERIQL